MCSVTSVVSDSLQPQRLDRPGSRQGVGKPQHPAVSQGRGRRAGRPPASHVRQPPRDSPASSPFRFDSGLLPLHVSRGRPTVPGGHQLLHRTRGSQGGLVGHTSGPLNGLPLTFDRSTPLSALLGEPCLKPNPTRLSSSTTLCAPFSSCLFRS